MFTGTPDIGEKMLYAAYIDPGTGFVFSSFLPAALGLIAGFLGSILLFLRKKIGPFIKKHWKILGSAILILAVATILFVIKNINAVNRVDKKVVILGLDGLDPKLVDEGMQKGLLPNLKKLKENGSYSRLATTMPPQSPVAWASFMTGKNPGSHKVFDFIERNPQDYSLDLVFSNPKRNPIKAEPFWKTAERNNIPVEVLFLPDTFPVSDFKGKMISGMGTPDILGTEGSFTLFSSENRTLDPKWRGRFVSIPDEENIRTSVQGPKFTFLKDKKVTSIPFEIKKDGKKKRVSVNVQNQKVELHEGEFSHWVRLQFSIDFFTKIHGIAKFYLKSEDPLELYLSPMNFDPENPVYQIASPKGFSKELAKTYGDFSTLGLPHDTWALEENIFDEKAFLKQADDIFEERKKIIFGELAKFKSGIFFGYFGVTDTISHMYWRYLEQSDSLYQNSIMSYYQKTDSVVGTVLNKLGKNDVLIILSDHGFDRFDYEMNVNTWLKENGYLTFKEGKETGGELLQDIDWSRTKAYAAGYNGIFLNIKGREGEGAIDKGEVEKLSREITDKLMTVVNPLSGKKVFKKIYSREDLGISKDEQRAPDLQLGYFVGLRSSWDTAVGAAPDVVFQKRKSKWSGDHLFDSTEIPGVFFTNKKIKGEDLKITDIISLVFKDIGVLK